jgi:hypothetical protein
VRREIQFIDLGTDTETGRLAGLQDNIHGVSTRLCACSPGNSARLANDSFERVRAGQNAWGMALFSIGSS